MNKILSISIALLLLAIAGMHAASAQVIGLQPKPQGLYTWDSTELQWTAQTTTDTSNPAANTPEPIALYKLNTTLNQWVPCTSLADCTGSGPGVTWPASADLVISNSTNSPTGLAPVNGDCVVGSGGAWTAGSCPGGGGVTQIIAGVNVSITPSGGTGAVTVNASGINVIYDDDCANDPDCAVTSIPALARWSNTGSVNVLALIADSSNAYAAPAMRILSSFYGMGNVPVGAWLGAVPSSNTTGNVSAWTSQLTTQFNPGDVNTNYPSCVTIYRTALASAQNSSVKIVTTGMLTCLDALMQSSADSISSLTGKQLIQAKVYELDAMAGFEPSTGSAEFNFAQDAVSAQDVLTNWTTANGYPNIYFSGENSGAGSVNSGVPSAWPSTNPSAYVGALLASYTRPSWDPLALYQAIFADVASFTVSGNGTNSVTVTSGGSAGLNVYATSPSAGHYYLTLSQSSTYYENILNAAIAAQGAGGQAVNTLNALAGNITLAAGTGIGVSINGSTITVNCTACGGAGGGLFAGVLSTLPTLSGTGLTTAYNQSGTFSVANSSVGVSMSDTNQGGWDMEGVLTAYPTPPFTLTTLISTEPLGINNVGVGLVIAASPTGKAYYFDATYNNAFQIQLNQANSPTSWDSTIYSPALSGSYVWMQIVDNGTTVTFNASHDGVNFVPIGAPITKSSSWLAGNFNYIGVAINPEGAGVSSSLMSWTH